MHEKEGLSYTPDIKPAPACKKGDFIFSAVGLDHGHIFNMAEGLIEAGASIKYVYDNDPLKIREFIKRFPAAKAASSEREVLDDKETLLVAGACIPGDRCDLGLRVMDSGKHYFTDKAPLTTLEQLNTAKNKVRQTGKKYAVYYSERLHVESAVFAGQLIRDGAIGKVLQVIGLGPHRINAASRPGWFFQKERYGGILCDIGSHQIEQYLFYAAEEDAEIVSSQIANYAYPQYPELDDFGDATLLGKNGTTNYFRVDWLTPGSVRAFGDGRTMILGDKGYIEIRKYTDIGTERGGDNLYLLNDKTEKRFELKGKVGFPYFNQLILDCMSGTENAMTQAHAFKAAELCIMAQMKAIKIK